jgi:hypothetical protein
MNALERRLPAMRRARFNSGQIQVALVVALALLRLEEAGAGHVRRRGEAHQALGERRIVLAGDGVKGELALRLPLVDQLHPRLDLGAGQPPRVGVEHADDDLFRRRRRAGRRGGEEREHGGDQRQLHE